MADGRIQFRDEGGKEAGKRVPAGIYPQFAAAPVSLASQHQRLGLGIDAKTAVPLWGGESMDYSHAIEALQALH